MSDDYDHEPCLTIDENPNIALFVSNGEPLALHSTKGSPDISSSVAAKSERPNIKTPPLKTTKRDNSNHDRQSPPKKRKWTTNNKSCQTEYDTNCELRPDIRVLLDVTLVFATDPNTLFFTTNWKGRQYHGVITDGVSPKTHLFARERAERSANSKNAVGAENGQNVALKRGKRLPNRGNERKGRLNPEECLVFDGPLSSHVEETKRTDEPPNLTQCPHKQCGHIFQSTAQVNQHLIFRHVNEKAILTENTASQSAPVRTHSIGCDPIPELPALCAKCSSSLSGLEVAGNFLSPVVTSLDFQQFEGSVDTTNSCGDVKAARSSTPFSDISDDAPTLTKEESFEKRCEQPTRQPLNFTSPLLTQTASSPSLDSSNVQDLTDSSNSQKTATSVSDTVTSKPKTLFSALTSASAQTAAISQHQLYFDSLLGLAGSSSLNPLIVPPTRKTGGVATTGSPFSDPSPRTSVNGMTVSASPTSEVMRQKVPDFKSESLTRQSPSTSTATTQQNSSPNPTATNVITSTVNAQRGQAAFVRPSAYPLQFPPFFARPPLGHPQYLNAQQQQHLIQLAAMINPGNNVSNLFMPAANRNEFN